MGDNLIYLSDGSTILENSSVYDITMGAGSYSNESASSGSLTDWQKGASDIADIFRTGAAGVRDTIDLLTGKKKTSTVAPGGSNIYPQPQIDLGMIAMIAAVYWLVKNG